MRWKEIEGDNVGKAQLEPCMIFGSLSPNVYVTLLLPTVLGLYSPG